MAKRLLLLLSNAASARSDGDFLQALLEAWVRVAPGDFHALIRRHEEGNRVEFRLPGIGLLGPEHPLPQLFAKLWASEHPLETHPSTAAFLKNGPGAYLRSQLEPDRVWKKRAHYRVLDKPQGIEDMVSIFLEPSKGTLVTVHTGSFTSPINPAVLRPAQEFADVANILFQARGGISKGREEPSRKLTRRETQIMEWVSRGNRNAEIAKILGVSQHTIRKHLENAFAKLGVENRTAAAGAFERIVRRARCRIGNL
ncbi:MAG: response regulator transcription factor [Verrucomicrobiota bacterium]